MARQTNIVSFNDVKKASQYRRLLDDADGARSAGARAGYVYYDLSKFADPKPQDLDEGWPEEYAYDPERDEERPSRLSRLGGLFARGSSGDARAARRATRRDPGFEDQQTQGYQEFQDFADYGDYADYQDYQDVEPASSRATSRSATAREQRRASRSKARAGRLFEQQYAQDDVPSQAEGAPRAALYEAQMGTSHRRAARMQRASEAGSSMAKFNPAGWFSNIRVSARQMKIATAALCLVLAVAFLYTPARHYYQSVREHDRLVAEYAVVEERNAALTQKNESLASNAGMEDAVREKYGYVVSGQTVGRVSGLSDNAAEGNGSASDVEANVLSSTVKAPEEWYTPYLDALFGVS